MNVKKILIIAITALIIAGCGNRPEPTPTIDPVAVMTDVAGTVQAEVTQNALLTPSATIPPPATPTLPPVPTQVLPSIPTSSTGPVAPTIPADQLPDNATFVDDIGVQDGDDFWQGERFTKTWQIENVGTTTWDTSYRLVYKDGPFTSEELVFNLVKPVEPGQLLNISVVMTAPETLGTYTNYWQMMNADGQFFGDVLSMKIVVGTELDKTPIPAG
jgi:hypothetical protein